MSLSKIFVSLLLSICISASPFHALEDRGQVSAKTTFRLMSSCNSTEQALITQAHKDALVLANAAMEDGRELLSTLNQDGKTINFNSRAAIDYWGPPKASKANQQKVIDAMFRATQTYRGLGWSDSWNDRYVDVTCNDPNDECEGDVVAYTDHTGDHNNYPLINYCKIFFNKLPSHGEQVDNIKADSSGRMKENIRNLRSRATTSLHEWFHIDKSSAEVCLGGCEDVLIFLDNGKETKKAYKAGRAKLLANLSPPRATDNNDNYVYFAMSKFMEKTFGTYPRYPTSWDPSKSQKENEAIEAGQPGAPASIQPWEIPDFGDNDNGAPTVTASPLAATEYPSWYQPVVRAGATTSLPAISVPSETPLPLAEPNMNTVACDSINSAPAVDDCVHAFGNLIAFPNNPATKGKKGKTWWAAYVDSCALAIKYTDDWTDKCNATLLDVQGHAGSVFEGCENVFNGKVAGSVPFAVPNCPANIEIIHTDGGSPPSGT